MWLGDVRQNSAQENTPSIEQQICSIRMQFSKACKIKCNLLLQTSDVFTQEKTEAQLKVYNTVYKWKYEL